MALIASRVAATVSAARSEISNSFLSWVGVTRGVVSTTCRLLVSRMKGAPANYGGSRVMLRQAQHERKLPDGFMSVPFALSLSKPVLSLSKGGTRSDPLLLEIFSLILS